MLEIIFLIMLTKKIGRICEDRGRKAGGFKVLTVLLWFGGEIVGAVLAASSGAHGIGVYIFALFGAAAGAGISVLIVNTLMPVQKVKLPSPSSEILPINILDENINKETVCKDQAKVIVELKNPGFLLGVESIEFILDGNCKELMQFGDTKEFDIDIGAHSAKVTLHGVVKRTSKELLFSVEKDQIVHILGKYSRAWGKINLELI